MTARRKTPLLLLTMLGTALVFLLLPTSGMAVHNAGCPLSGSPPTAPLPGLALTGSWVGVPDGLGAA
jgi:hypothetical protein